jgi:uncharacterized membrane protein
MSGERTSILAVALAASVLANLFLAGVLVGQITFPGFRFGGGNPGSLVAREEIRALPEDERRAFIRAMRSHQPEMKALRDHVREARRAVAEAVGAPVYDSKLLETRFAALRQAQDAQGTAQHEAIIEALGKLSPASRATIARHAEEAVDGAR